MGKTIALLLVFLGLVFPKTKVEGVMEKARTWGKPVVFYFKSPFCVYCTQLEEFVLSDDEVYKKISNFFFVELDIKSEEGNKLAKKFGVTGVPTLVVYDPKQDKVLGLIFGSRPKQDFMNMLTKACKFYNIKTC